MYGQLQECVGESTASAVYSHTNSTHAYTGKNREKNGLKICVFLQNSEEFSQNEQFFSQIVWLSDDLRKKLLILRKKFRILE